MPFASAPVPVDPSPRCQSCGRRETVNITYYYGLSAVVSWMFAIVLCWVPLINIALIALAGLFTFVALAFGLNPSQRNDRICKKCHYRQN